MTPEIAENIIAITMTRGGGTFNRRGALIERKKGFVVGIFKGSFAIMALSESEFAYETFKSLLSQFPGAFIGTWLNKGKIYIDPVQIYDNREDAEGMARVTNQIAIYSFESGEIFVG